MRKSTKRPRTTEEVREPWQVYGWFMAVGWLGFLFFPIRNLLDSTAPG